MWPLQRQKYCCSTVAVDRGHLQKHTDALAEAGGMSGWCKKHVPIQVCASLCIIIGVSYWSLHQTHAETTADYRNADSVDGLPRRNSNMISFAVFKRKIFRCACFLTIIPFLGLFKFSLMPNLRFNNKWWNTWCNRKSGLTDTLISHTWKASRSFPLKSMISEEPAVPFSPG